MRGRVVVGDIMFVTAVAALQAHPSAVARSSPNITCFDVELYDRLGDGWNGANYLISTVDDGWTVIIAGGTLEDGFNRTDEVCVAPNACYTMEVSAPTPRWMRFGISWSLGNGALSGRAPDQADFFVSADDGEIFPGCTAATTPPPSSIKMTVTPTASSSARTLFATASCFERNCVANATFDTAAVANFIVLAELTVDVDGNFRRRSSRGHVQIAINDDVVGTCGEALCTKSRCSSFNGTDVTAAARTGTLVLSFTVSPNVDLPCGIIGDSPSYYFQGDAWLDLELSEMTLPTPAPTITSPPSPLAAYSPRTMVAVVTCLDNKCYFDVTLDTSTFADFIESAKLTLALSGSFGYPGAFAEITIDGEDFGECGNRFPTDQGSVVVDYYREDDDAEGFRCVKSAICSNVNKTDVTVAARAGTVVISILANSNLIPVCGFDQHAVKARATLVVDLSDTWYPTPLPSMSLRPTTLIHSSPRTLVTTVTGSAEAVTATFDTSAFVGSLVAAELTIDVAGVIDTPYYYLDIAINGDDFGTCEIELSRGNSCLLKQRCLNFNGIDITTVAQTGMVVITFSASYLLGHHFCTYADRPKYSYEADVMLVVYLHESSFPTPFSTILSPTASVHTTPTGYALSTFEQLQGAILAEGPSRIKVRGHIVFQSQLDLSSVQNQEINGSGASDFTVFDGGFSTSLFRLENTTLTLEAITLANCWANVGGCVQATTSSLFLVSVRVVNCLANTYGGGFRLERNSLLHAVDSTFESNNATHGGVASLETSSKFEAVASNFTSNSAQVGGVATLNGSSFISTGSSFQKNSAISRAGVAWITNTSRFTATLSLFGANQGGTKGGGVIHSDVGSSFSATNSHFWMNYAVFRGGVACIEDNSTFMVTKSSFHGNSAIFLGGAIAALNSSTVMAAESSFTNNTAFVFGGVAGLRGSTFTAKSSTFEENWVNMYGGAFLGIWGSTFTVTGSSFSSNRAIYLGGVALLSASTWTSKNCSYTKNHAAGGGCFYAGQASVVTAAGSSFEDNLGFVRAGVIDLEKLSTFTAMASTFSSNSALNKGGVTYMFNGSTFTATNSSFMANYAGRGGCAFASSFSKFSVRNSSLMANRALRNGNLVFFTDSATIELYNSTIQDDKSNTSSMIHCFGMGMAYAALLHFELSERISLGTNCVLLLYQLNNNGTEAFRDVVIQKGVFEPSTASVNFVQWSYPCKQGQWSPDGIEHGQSDAYLDGNGLTINQNDPFCKSDDWPSPAQRCVSSCITCPAGTYLEFTLDRYAHIREESCTDCPAGKFLEDATQQWWFHDDYADCIECPPGRFASEPRSAKCDACQNGTYSTEPGSTSCAFIDPGYFVVDAASEPEKCPPGSFSVGGKDSCEACNIGDFQPMSGQIQCLAAEPGHFVDVLGAESTWPCPPGQFSLGQAHSCSNCSNGTFASGVASTSCASASPGYYVPLEGAPAERPCHPGSFSSDSGEFRCTECKVGSYQAKLGQPACVPAEPGYFVGYSGATEPQPCAAGRFSYGGNGICESCHIGEFQPNIGQASCIACPSPMTTTGVGKTYCDACIRSYFWNSLRWDNSFDQELVNNGTQCADCCVRCEVVCDVDDVDGCVACDEDGSELATLDVKRGWWRKTSESTTVYECRLNHACRGGSSTVVSEQCFDGHFGALCGACKEEYDHDIVRNRCVRCAGWLDLLVLPGNICVLIIPFFALLLFLMSKRFRDTVAEIRKVEMGPTSENRNADQVAACQQQGPDGEDELKNRRRSLWKSLVAKLYVTSTFISIMMSLLALRKVVIAAWQIASSAPRALLGVRFPPIFTKVAGAFGVFGLEILDVGSSKCLFGWSYFDKLLTVLFLVTLAPIGTVLLVGSLYWCYKHNHRNLDAKQVWSDIVYGTLFFIYVALPSISQYVFTYFSCARFNRGNRRDLRVIAVELSIKCTSKRYRHVAIYSAFMIAVWPFGVPLAIFCLLFKYRGNLNPSVNVSIIHATEEIDSELQELRPLIYTAKEQLMKLERRKESLEEEDSSIKCWGFLFEDYKPQSFLFSVFEITSRLFLSSFLAVFYPGSMQQVIVALLGAMFCFTFYFHWQAFIEDNDNRVAVIAQGELVLIYVGAVGVYISDTRDENRDFFTGDLFDFFMVALIFVTFLVSIALILLEYFGYASLRDVIEAMGAWRMSLRDTIGRRTPGYNEAGHRARLHCFQNFRGQSGEQNDNETYNPLPVG